MSRDQTEVQDTIERYLRGDLSDNETIAFEERLVWDTDVQNELVLSQRLRDGMRAVAGTPVESSAPPATHEPTAKLFGFLYSPVYAAAASVLVVVAALGWFATWITAHQSLTPAASASVYSLDVLRSANERSDWPVVSTGSGNWVTLLVYPDLTVHRDVRAQLALADGAQWRAVWQGDASAADSSDTFALTLPAKLLAAGAYRLQVIGLADGSDAGIAAEVFFRVE